MAIKNTGTKHDENKTRLDLIPPETVEALGKVLTFGCKKYSANNWRLGIDYSRVYSAIQRHLNAFWGEASDIDEESGLSHLSHALCGLSFLITYEDNKERYQTFDDRSGGNNEFYRQREELVGGNNAPPHIDQPCFPDLTKLSHSEACKYLKPGMKVKILHKVKMFAGGWVACWVSPMDSFVGKTMTIDQVQYGPHKGITFIEDCVWYFPAFVLEIIDEGE